MLEMPLRKRLYFCSIASRLTPTVGISIGCFAPTSLAYAIGLLGFGISDHPRANLKDYIVSEEAVQYSFDLSRQSLTVCCDEVLHRGRSVGRHLTGCVLALLAA